MKPADPRTVETLKAPFRMKWWDQALEALYEGNPERLKELLKDRPALERYLNDKAEEADRFWDQLRGKSPKLPVETLQELALISCLNFKSDLGAGKSPSTRPFTYRPVPPTIIGSFLRLIISSISEEALFLKDPAEYSFAGLKNLTR